MWTFPCKNDLNIMWCHLYVDCFLKKKVTQTKLYKRETDLENKLMVTKAERWCWWGQARSLGFTYRRYYIQRDNKQVPAIEHRELHSIFYNNLHGKQFRKNNRYVYVCVCTCVSHSFMSNSESPWTTVCQAPLSEGFSRQEYWSGLPLPSLGYTYMYRCN